MKITLFLIVFLFFSLNLQAVTFSPEKKSHLFQTFGLFTEEGQTAILNQGGSRYWAELASRITILELEQVKFNPQLIVNAGVMDSLRYEKKEFQSDTQDLRVGIALLMTLNSQTRMMFTLTHLSGHVLEDVADKSLISVNVGDEILGLRVIHDEQYFFRYGASLKYIFGSENNIKRLNADQFFEWMPFGENLSGKQYIPFSAIGLEENGFTQYEISSHIQAGIYWGNHFQEKHSELVKLSLGYYSGLDPRQKYSHYIHSKSHFLYGGLGYEF